MKKLNVIIGMVLLALAMSTTSGLMAQPTGQKIMENVYNLPKGEDMQGELAMTLINRQGERRVRNLKQYSKDFGNVEKKIMFFLSPADVQGTSFMNWSYTDGRDDDQWIYLPALRRVRRISSDSKGDYFMGSDFAYDDLGDRHPDEDKHTLIREETVDGKACYVVESTPKATDYMYSKTISWVMKDSNLGIKREFYDDRGRLLKILSIKKFEKINGYWTILETEMKNVQNNHTTHMKFTSVQYNQGIPDMKFTERSLTLGE